jgi:hypothetical protein
MPTLQDVSRDALQICWLQHTHLLPLQDPVGTLAELSVAACLEQFLM